MSPVSCPMPNCPWTFEPPEIGPVERVPGIAAALGMDTNTFLGIKRHEQMKEIEQELSSHVHREHFLQDWVLRVIQLRKTLGAIERLVSEGETGDALVMFLRDNEELILR